MDCRLWELNARQLSTLHVSAGFYPHAIIVNGEREARMRRFTPGAWLYPSRKRKMPPSFAPGDRQIIHDPLRTVRLMIQRPSGEKNGVTFFIARRFRSFMPWCCGCPGRSEMSGMWVVSYHTAPVMITAGVLLLHSYNGPYLPHNI